MSKNQMTTAVLTNPVPLCIYCLVFFMFLFVCLFSFFWGVFSSLGFKHIDHASLLVQCVSDFKERRRQFKSINIMHKVVDQVSMFSLNIIHSLSFWLV